ncbi:MAG: 4Fe-4S binding protein [Candidatus Krumholzibacteria bacterium]|nr:4Fe-4S binding protein [Candidatus Krumholzibacteria bacterium]
MWFRKSERQSEPHPFPGEEQALDGHAAAYAVETMACEAVLVQSAPDFAEIAGPLRKLVPEADGRFSSRSATVRLVDQPRPLAAMAVGYAEVGLRSAALISGLGGIEDELYATAGKRLPIVINLTCRAMRKQAGSLHGSHDDYYRAGGAGFFQLFASNPQEVADFTLIAHRIAELALTPGICAQDLYQTSHSVQSLHLPEKELVLEYLGRPDELIDCPTAAQAVLFGERRRRIPRFLDLDRAVGVGGVQDQDSFFNAVAAQRAFFYDQLGDIVDTAMREFGELTGRHYDRVSGYRVEDADTVVIAQGGLVEELKEVVDYCRDHENAKVGVAALSAFRPFPGAKLAGLLKGKRAVTVLERADQPLAEDLPLLREVRCAIDKAIENGITPANQPPYPSYERYALEDRPQFFSGMYGIGGSLPRFADLLVVYSNMLAVPKTRRAEGKARTEKRQFYVGVDFHRNARRFPHLQTLQQELNKGYPGLERLSLKGVEDFAPGEQVGRTMQLLSLSIQGGLFAGNLFARTLCEVMKWRVKTHPDGGLEQSLQPTCFAICHTDGDHPPRGKATAADVVLISTYSLLEHASLSSIKNGGTLIVESSHEPRDLWNDLSKRIRQLIRKREVRFYGVDARKVASETASNPSFVDQLAVWALLGAYLSAGLRLSTEDVQGFVNSLWQQLERVFGPGHYLIEDIANTVTRAAAGLVELDWPSWPTQEPGMDTGRETPWTVKQAASWDGTLFDVTRFWHSVGYLYDSGQANETLTDPYLATGIMPARSSAFRDMTSYRLRMPRWLPENCTGCGLCWASCPESALPPTILSLSSIIDTAISECERQGTAIIQMKRVGAHLAKQAYRLLTKNGLTAYVTLGPLVSDAFSRLIEGMGLQGEKLEEMTREFELLRESLNHLQVAKTETFFDEPQKNEKGSGTLLSIVVNPLSCTGCGLCVGVCPDNALEWTEQTVDRVKQYQENWQLQMKFPRVTEDLLATHISPRHPDTLVNRLLDKTAYHSMVGGDGSAPGSGAKIAVHLLTATIESFMRPRLDAHVTRLSRLIERLEEKIQGKVSDTLAINDFDSFGRRLSRLQHTDLTADKLVGMIGGAGKTGEIDSTQLKRLTALLGLLEKQKQSYEQCVTGTGRARMFLAIDPGEGVFWSGTYPYNPHSHPWVCHLPGDAPALAEGLFEGVTRRLVEELKICRRAELELSDSYTLEHDSLLEKFDWTDLETQELQLIPPVVVIGRTGTTSWDGMSRLFAQRLPIKIAIVNTDGLSVVQRPDVDHTDGSLTAAPHTSERDEAFLALMRGDVFVLQATVGQPGHLMWGIEQGLTQHGPALFHIYAPDPQAHGIATEDVVRQAKLAYQSRAFPLFKFDPAGSQLTLEANPHPDRDWTSHELTVAEPSGETSSHVASLTVADWAVGEARYKEHFKIVTKGHRNDQMKPLAQYLKLKPEEREGVQPYIDIVDSKQRHFLAIVSTDLAGVTEERRDRWRYLQRLAETTLTPEAFAQAMAKPETSGRTPTVQSLPDSEKPASGVGRSAYQRLTERLLALSGYSEDPEFFKRSLKQFVTGSDQSRSDE